MQAAESDNSAAAWTFSQCLDYAYSNNISLQRLVLDNQSDEATLEQSKAQWQPTLGFSTTQGYINYASPSENQTANVYSGSYGLNASWTVFNGNIRRNQIKYDEMQQRISALGIDEQRYTLQTEILSKYLNILYAKEAIAIARKNVEVSKYQMERAEALMNSGKLSRVDYSQIESQWHTDRYSLTAAETNLASAKMALKSLLELNITTDFDIAGIDFNDAEIAAELPRKTTVFETACLWMPALQRYKLAGEAEQYGIDIARGGYYPSVVLNAGVGTSNTSGSGNLGTQLKDRLNEQISVTVSVPILDQKKNKTAVAKARIAQLNADLDNMQVIADVDEADIGQVKVGQRVTFSVDAYPDDVFNGKVTQVRLNPTEESNVITYEVVVSADNADHKLIPGLTANITIYTAESQNALIVPASALKFSPKDIDDESLPQKAQDAPADAKAVVWTVRGDKLYPVAVTTGTNNGVNVEIVSGLKKGDVVAVDYSADMAAQQAGGSEESSPFAPKHPGQKKKEGQK